jgi:FixJ family two-component response regulator
MEQPAYQSDRAVFRGGAPGTVVVVDDDQTVRAALRNLIRSVDLKVEAFGSPPEFLARMDPDRANCLVLDVRLPGKNGLDFHDELKRMHVTVPVIFITAYSDVAMAVRAMKAGAVEFLLKPFRDQELLDAIQLGIAQDRERRARQRVATALRARYATLTSRERDVIPLVAKGLRNKAIATELGISDVTVKAHRSQVMLKMNAQTLADLIRMADALHELNRDGS